jgi:hypothetical protein
MFMDEASCTWRGFSTATTVMSRQKQTLMLHLFTATNNTLWSMFGWAMTIWLGLTCYPDGSVHRFTATRNAGGNPIASQEKLVVPTWQDFGSLRTPCPKTSHHHLQPSLDWMRLANGLASQLTGPHTKMTSSYVATLQPWFTCH